MVRPHSFKRTFVKAVSWEFISNFICLWLAYYIFGNLGNCLIFTLVCILIKLGLFVPHDELWHQIKWGK
jgi:uncharacterized membrane protein